MQNDLEERLRFFANEGLVDAAIVSLIRKVIMGFESEFDFNASDDVLGPLVAHLLIALERIRRDEDIGEAWDPNVHEEALGHPYAYVWAERIARMALMELTIVVPSKEIDFIGLHVGSFLKRIKH